VHKTLWPLSPRVPVEIVMGGNGPHVMIGSKSATPMGTNLRGVFRQHPANCLATKENDGAAARLVCNAFNLLGATRGQAAGEGCDLSSEPSSLVQRNGAFSGAPISVRRNIVVFIESLILISH